MHSIFLSSTRSGLHGLIFAFHLHTLSLSSGRSRLSLALLRIRIPWGCPFGSFSAQRPDSVARINALNNTSFTTNLRHTIPFQSFLNNIPLINTPSLAAVADNDCPQDVEDDTANIDCSVETADPVLRRSRAVVQTIDAAPLAAYNAAFARRTLRRTAPNMDLSAPQAVDLMAPDDTPRDSDDDGVGGSGVLGIAVAAIKQNGKESLPPTLLLNRAAWQHAMVVFVIAIVVPDHKHAANGTERRRRRRRTGVDDGTGAEDGTGAVATLPIAYDAAFEFPARRTLRSAAPNTIPSAPWAVDPTSVSSAPAALRTGTSADDGTGTADAPPAASAASERQTGVYGVNG